ncbi:TetR/AcrR family transcriptional regulator [Caproiciproducens sp.]
MEELTHRQQQALETKAHILDSALELFGQESFENVKITDICQKAGVSVGTFYYYFKDKDSIIKEGYRHFDEELRAWWKSYEPRGTAEDIFAFIQKQFELLLTHGYRIDAQFFKSQLTSVEKYILDERRFSYQVISDLVEKLIANHQLAGEPHEITKHIFMTTRGTLYDWCMYEGSYNLVTMCRKSVGIVLYYYSASADSR